MLKERAVVMAYQTNIAVVRCETKQACGGCKTISHCGTSALSALTKSTNEHILTVNTPMPLKVGQIIEIGLKEQVFFSSLLLVYVFPLSVLLISVFISDRFFTFSDTELPSIFFIFFSTALSFIAVHFYVKKHQNYFVNTPVFLRIIDEGKE